VVQLLMRTLYEIPRAVANGRQSRSSTSMGSSSVVVTSSLVVSAPAAQSANHALLCVPVHQSGELQSLLVKHDVVPREDSAPEVQAPTQS
jgi:hypothetical protein